MRVKIPAVPLPSRGGHTWIETSWRRVIMSKTIRKRRDFESRARATKQGIRKSWREIPYDGDWEEEPREVAFGSGPFVPSLGARGRREPSESRPSPG